MATGPFPYAASTASDLPQKIKLVSHSPLFSWWPVWAVGFLMALLTVQGLGHGRIAHRSLISQGREGSVCGATDEGPPGCRIRRDKKQV